MKNIYLDNAAAAPVAPEVQKEIGRVMKLAGNPSSFNDAGRESAAELKKARLLIARFLGAHEEEIVFTSSGSEANNLAIRGAVAASGKKDGSIVTTKIEHPSVLEPVKYLGQRGFKVVFAGNDKEGMVTAEGIKEKISPETILVSVMYANNEIGTIEPVRKIGEVIQKIRRERNSSWPLFHVDACQAAGYLNMNADNLKADLLTFNGSKISGPRGVGVLYVRKGTKIEPLVLGGGQERGMRAGTENLPAISGLAKAVSLINKGELIKTAKLRDYFIRQISEVIPEAKLNGASGEGRLPNNVSISIPGVTSENLLLELDKHGISAGSGSACTARSVESSHVLKAIGAPAKYLDGVIRFSLGRNTKKADIDYVVKVLPGAVLNLKKRYKK